MARKTKQPKAANQALDRVQQKAQKQKRLAIALSALLLLVLVYEVPHTMKLMKSSPNAVVVNDSTGTAPAPNPTVTTTALPNGATPTASDAAAPTETTSIVASVQAVADPGQLTQFERFASKDPFDQSVQKSTAVSPSTSSKTSTTSTTPSLPKAPPAPPPASVVISLNGTLVSVASGTDFPASSPVFHLLSATQRTAKITIAGGSYADGAPALTLTVGKAVTLQNTADGTQYTLILEPQGTQVPTLTSATSTTPATPAAPTSTTSVVPSTSG